MLLAPVHAPRLPVRESGARISKVLISVAGALAILLAAGCGAASPNGNYPVVVAHPVVQTSGFSSLKLGAEEARLLAPARIAFLTTGTTSCAWLPTRLAVLSPSSIRIDMRVNGRVTSCSGGGVAFPIAVKLPRIVDVHDGLTVELAYKVHIPGAGTRQWDRTAVAAALP